MMRPTLPQLRRTVNALLPRPGECFDARPARLILGALLGCDCALNAREYSRDELGRFAPVPFSETARDYIMSEARRKLGTDPGDHLSELYQTQKDNSGWRKSLAFHLKTYADLKKKWLSRQATH